MVFLCYVKRIKGELQTTLSQEPAREYFRGFKEVFCLHLECVIAARMIFLKHISDHITWYLNSFCGYPLPSGKRSHFLAWNGKPFMISLMGVFPACLLLSPYVHGTHWQTPVLGLLNILKISPHIPLSHTSLHFSVVSFLVNSLVTFQVQLKCHLP